MSGLPTISCRLRSASACLAATRSCSERAAMPARWSPDFSSLALAKSSRRSPNLKDEPGINSPERHGEKQDTTNHRVGAETQRGRKQTRADLRGKDLPKVLRALRFRRLARLSRIIALAVNRRDFA